MKKITMKNGLRAIQTLLTVAALMMVAQAAFAQGRTITEVGGTSVLLFPVTGLPTDVAGKDAQSAITDGLVRFLRRNGASVSLYSRRLPSIQRAVDSGELKREDAIAGPADNQDKAQRMADIVGANEYLVASVENFKYDTDTRTATFSLTVIRRATAGNLSLGSASQNGQGVAPADVSASRQPGSAVARAAEAAGEEVANALYPRPAQVDKPVKVKSHHTSSKHRNIILIGVAALLALFVIKSNR